MRITKRTVASLERVYSIATVPGVKVDGWPAFLAGSEGAGPTLYFEPPQYEPIEIADGPGGFISLWAFEQGASNYVVAATDFKPGFEAENRRIIVHPLDEAARGEAFEAGRLPYTHRAAVLAFGGRQPGPDNPGGAMFPKSQLLTHVVRFGGRSQTRFRVCSSPCLNCATRSIRTATPYNSQAKCPP